MPAWSGVPHHASNSSEIDIECEQACLTKSIADHDLIIGQRGELPLQPEFQAEAASLERLPPRTRETRTGTTRR